MKTLQLPKLARDDAFLHGILAKKPVQVSHKGKDGWHLYQGHLKRGTMEDGIQLAELTPTFGEGETSSGKVGITFRLGHKKMLCHTSGHLPYVEWPDNLVAVQRKAFKRQDPIDVLSMRMWPLGKQDNDHVIHGEVKNISTGGIQVSIRERKLEDCYYCSINSDPCIAADALVRTIEPDGNESIIVGMQFVGLELDPNLDGVKRLVKLLSMLGRRAGSHTVTL